LPSALLQKGQNCKTMLNCLDEYAKRKGLTINTAKSEVVAQNNLLILLVGFTLETQALSLLTTLVLRM